MIDVVGDVVAEDGSTRREQLELWRRDPVECVMELIGNPAFRDAMAYVPERAYADSEGKNRIYDEMWTADWWWDVQVSSHLRMWRLTRSGTKDMLQGKLPAGATVAPVILSSDKTSLSVFSGDKKAWPIYLSPSSSASRRKPAHWQDITSSIMPCLYSFDLWWMPVAMGRSWSALMVVCVESIRY